MANSREMHEAELEQIKTKHTKEMERAVVDAREKATLTAQTEGTHTHTHTYIYIYICIYLYIYITYHNIIIL